MIDFGSGIFCLGMDFRYVDTLLLIGDVGMNGYFLLFRVQGFKYNDYGIFQSGSIKCKGYIYGSVCGLRYEGSLGSYFFSINKDWLVCCAIHQLTGYGILSSNLKAGKSYGIN